MRAAGRQEKGDENDGITMERGVERGRQKEQVSDDDRKASVMKVGDSPFPCPNPDR